MKRGARRGARRGKGVGAITALPTQRAPAVLPKTRCRNRLRAVGVTVGGTKAREELPWPHSPRAACERLGRRDAGVNGGRERVHNGRAQLGAAARAEERWRLNVPRWQPNGCIALVGNRRLLSRDEKLSRGWWIPVFSKLL